MNNRDDDSLAYERSLKQFQKNTPQDDPLKVVKDMRLQQLAACRLKAANELEVKNRHSKGAKPKTR